MIDRTRLSLFREEYTRSLTELKDVMIDCAIYPEYTLQAIVDRVMLQLERDLFNKNGSAFKLTCSRLGIKNTYLDINYWVHGLER